MTHSATLATSAATTGSISSDESVSTTISSPLAQSVADAVRQSMELAQPTENNDVPMESQASESATNPKESTNEAVTSLKIPTCATEPLQNEASTEGLQEVEKETPVTEVAAPVTPSTDVHSFASQNTTPEKSSEKGTRS